MTEALAVYGSLAPGQESHWVVSRIAGQWKPGVALGYVFEVTWGPAEGYQGFIADPDGLAVVVSVLQSSELTKKWREIDEFMGAGFERAPVSVELDDGGVLAAQIHVALTDS